MLKLLRALIVMIVAFIILRLLYVLIIHILYFLHVNVNWVPRSMMDQWKVTEDGRYEYRFEIHNFQKSHAEFRVHLKDLETGEKKRVMLDIDIKELSSSRKPQTKDYDWAVMKPTDLVGYYRMTTSTEFRRMEEFVFLVNLETEEVELIEEVYFSHIVPPKTIDGRYRYRLRFINLFKDNENYTEDNGAVDGLILIHDPRSERGIELDVKDVETDEERLISIFTNLDVEEVWETIANSDIGDIVLMEPTDRQGYYTVTLSSKLLKEERRFEVNVKTHEVKELE